MKNWDVNEDFKGNYADDYETITLFQFSAKTRIGEENLWTDLIEGLYQTLLHGKKVENFIIYLSNCEQTSREGLGTSSLNCSCHQGCLI